MIQELFFIPTFFFNYTLRKKQKNLNTKKILSNPFKTRNKKEIINCLPPRLRTYHIKRWNMFTKAAPQCYLWELTVNKCFLN